MRFKKFSLSFAAVQVMFLPMGVYAQSQDFDPAFARQGAEARISFTVPLGGSEDKSKTAPRLNFGIRNYTQPSAASLDWMRSDGQNYQDVRLGLTIETLPKLMLNEQILLLPETEQANIGTAGKIGLGVAAVAVVGVAVIAVLFAECSNDSGGCFGDE